MAARWIRRHARRGYAVLHQRNGPDTLAIIEACLATPAPLTVVGEADVRRLEGLLGGVDELPPDEDALLGAPYQKWNAALSMAVVQRFLPELEPGRLVRCWPTPSSQAGSGGSRRAFTPT